MTVTITATLRRSIPAENQYQVQVDVIDATNIWMDVLVFDTEYGSYSRVASVYDLETYPVGQTAAAAANIPYFRDRGVSITYPTLQSATEFESVTAGRLQTLAKQWDTLVTSFSGDETITADSSAT